LNGRKIPEDALARIIGLDNQSLTTSLTTILDLGVASVEPETGVIYCRRMVRDEKTRQERVKAGKMGGNPVLLNQNPTTRVKQNPTPSARAPVGASSSSSSSSSISDTDTEEPQPFQGANAVCTYCGVKQSEVAWAFEIDHFLPRTAGGTDDPENLVTCCHVCNQIKQGQIFKSIEEARAHIHLTLWSKNRARYKEPRTHCFGGKPPAGFRLPSLDFQTTIKKEIPEWAAGFARKWNDWRSRHGLGSCSTASPSGQGVKNLLALPKENKDWTPEVLERCARRYLATVEDPKFVCAFANFWGKARRFEAFLDESYQEPAPVSGDYLSEFMIKRPGEPGYRPQKTEPQLVPGIDDDQGFTESGQDPDQDQCEG
jgi:5-methylcytosine-specific restriction endonuclease McrA